MTKEVKTAHQERAHAEFSASGAERWLNCPGSIRLCKDLPEPPESEYAKEGTRAHECLEFLLKNRQKLGAACKTALRSYPKEMVDHAREACEWVLDRLKARPNADFFSETKVDSSSFTCSDQFGTLDIGIADEFNRLTIVDYKYGAGIAVDPEGHDGKGNHQLLYYALALSERYEHNFTEVELVIIQPRAFHESGETIRSVTMPMNEVLTWRKKFRDGVMATSDKDAKFNPGKWCKFCRGGVKCPALKDEALKRAQVVFNDEKGLVLPDPALVTIPNLGRVLEGCDRLETWIEKVREFAFSQLNAGQEVKGYKLVQKRGQRKWGDENKIVREAENKFGPAVFSTKLLSPAQLEKQFPHLSGWVEERVVVESSGLTMAPESDKRPAVTTASQAFQKAPLPSAAKKSKVKA